MHSLLASIKFFFSFCTPVVSWWKRWVVEKNGVLFSWLSSSTVYSIQFNLIEWHKFAFNGEVNHILCLMIDFGLDSFFRSLPLNVQPELTSDANIPVQMIITHILIARIRSSPTNWCENVALFRDPAWEKQNKPNVIKNISKCFKVLQ